MAAAESAGPEAREIADRLGFALDPAARLAMMEAISQAAAEITAAMPSGGVDVRLDGRDLDFAVHAPTPETPPESAPAATQPVDEGDLARVSLRIPESVKARAEEAAAAAGQSLNTWLVSVVRAATSERALRVDVDLSSIPFGGDFPFRGKRGERRMTGWH
ncbi:toxin-antitoxin system HicB family antitoxin [Nocardioides sp. BGMRC 2183]|nr:toxin-antitoxin system HicB family antitoxin [Nocardioides sp. BGMRC 2183]